MSVVPMAAALRSTAVVTFLAFGAGGHGLDEEGADAMRQRLLALESEAGEMRRQLESLGIIAEGAEVETRFTGAVHGAAMEIKSLGPELLLELVVLLALGLIIYAVSRGSSVPPPSKGKQTRPGPANGASPSPAPRVGHTEARQPLARREKSAENASGGDDVWTNLQKVVARQRQRIVKEAQEGGGHSSAMPLLESCEPAEKKNSDVAHPWNCVKQEKSLTRSELDHADSQASGGHAIEAEAHEPQPQDTVKENAESPFAFEFPPGLTLPLSEIAQPSQEQSVEQTLGDQDVEHIAQTVEDNGIEHDLTEKGSHNECCPSDPQTLADLGDKQEQQTTDDEKDHAKVDVSEGSETQALVDPNGEEHLPCSSSSTAGAPLSSDPLAQKEAEPPAQEKAPNRTSTRKDRTRKVERRTAQQPSHSVTEASVDEDDWALPQPSMLAQIQQRLEGLAAPAEKGLHAVGQASAVQDKHESKKVRRQTGKQQKPAKTKVEQAPRWSVPRWPLGTRATIIVTVLFVIVLVGRMDWDMDDVTRLRKLADLKEQHRRATEQLDALRAEKARLTRAQALTDLSAFVGDVSDVLHSMSPAERIEAERLEGYQSDASKLLEALADIGEEEFPQVVKSYEQVSGHWQMVLATERAKQKRRKVFSDEDAACAVASDDAGS